jgi:hypothetical protein
VICLLSSLTCRPCRSRLHFPTRPLPTAWVGPISKVTSLLRAGQTHRAFIGLVVSSVHRGLPHTIAPPTSSLPFPSSLVRFLTTPHPLSSPAHNTFTMASQQQQPSAQPSPSHPAHHPQQQHQGLPSISSLTSNLPHGAPISPDQSSLAESTRDSGTWPQPGPNKCKCSYKTC